MLKNIRSFSFRQKKSELQDTPGETLRDSIIKAGIKVAEEVNYKAGNNTYLVIKFIEKLEALLIKDQH